MKWNIVVFPERNEVEIVPDSWCSQRSDGLCVNWPNVSYSKLSTCIKKGLNPSTTDWKKYNGCTLKAISEDWHEACTLRRRHEFYTENEDTEWSSPEQSTNNYLHDNHSAKTIQTPTPPRKKIVNAARNTSTSKGTRKFTAISMSPSEELREDETTGLPSSSVKKRKILNTPIKTKVVRNIISPRISPAIVHNNDSTQFSGNNINKKNASSQSDSLHISRRPITASEKSSFSDGQDTGELAPILSELKAELNEIKESVKAVIRQNESLKEEYRSLKRYHKSLLKKIHPLENVENEVSLPQLPIKSMEELDKFESLIKNEDARLALIRKLANVGGHDWGKVVYNTMNHLLSKEVASQFSRLGLKNKQSFKKLTLYKCVIDAVRQTDMCKERSDYDLDLKISSNLANARHRRKHQQTQDHESGSGCDELSLCSF